ncbi:hypothetical protein V8F20_005387 [Naviculisporaceae sp. PSN 640]
MKDDRDLEVPPATYSRERQRMSSPPPQENRLDAGAPGDNPKSLPNITSRESKLRRHRPRKSHEMVSTIPLSEEPTDNPRLCSWVTYFGARAKNEGYKSFIFLLWGSERSERAPTWAVDVPLTDKDAEEKVFQSLKDHYHKFRGFWGTCCYLRQGVTVTLVKFRFITRIGDRFQVWLEPIDVDRKRGDHLTELKELRELIDKTFQYETCGKSKGEVFHHDYGCPSWESEDAFCPVEEYSHVSRDLEWWRTIGFLSWFFRHPQAAEGHRILSKPSREVRILIDYESVPGWVCEGGLRYEEYYGLFVTDAWIVSRCVCAFIVLTIFAVPVGKVVFGSWEAAFAAASFLLAIPMVAFAMLTYSQ